MHSAKCGVAAETVFVAAQTGKDTEHFFGARNRDVQDPSWTIVACRVGIEFRVDAALAQPARLITTLLQPGAKNLVRIGGLAIQRRAGYLFALLLWIPFVFTLDVGQGLLDWRWMPLGVRCVEGLCQYQPLTCSSGQACFSGQCQASPVSFSVSLSPSVLPSSDTAFQTSRLTVTATLTNGGNVPIQVMATSLNTVSLVGATKNGVVLTPQLDLAWLNLRQDPFQNGVVTLQPGSSTSWPLRGIESLVLFDGSKAIRTSYVSTGPGVYTFTFRYQYQGDPAVPVDFAGSLVSQPVTVTLH
jgi:hypothetical protein